MTGLLRERSAERAWRACFLAGLLSVGALVELLRPSAIGSATRAVPELVLAGLLVGIGTRLGRGCTSGHGVCGLSRLSVPSLVATCAFVASGIFTLAALRALGAFP